MPDFLVNYLPDLKELLYVVPAILIGFTLHEYAHALASYKLGDPTPKIEGRLSLNPFIHLDLMGTLMLLIFRFGWAKPVMVNPMYYKKPKRDMGIVAFAGPLMNFVLAFLSLFIIAFVYKFFDNENSLLGYVIVHFFSIFVSINTGLGVFNMLPLPPLDGSKVVGAFLSDRLFYQYLRLEPYGMAILLILVFTNTLSIPLRFLIDIVSDFYEWIITFLLF